MSRGPWARSGISFLTFKAVVAPRACQERSVLERHQKLEISEVQTSRTAVLDGTQKLKVFDDTSAFVKPRWRIVFLMSWSIRCLTDIFLNQRCVLKKYEKRVWKKYSEFGHFRIASGKCKCSSSAWKWKHCSNVYGRRTSCGNIHALSEQGACDEFLPNFVSRENEPDWFFKSPSLYARRRV